MPPIVVLPLAVNSINGVSNESRRGMSRAADPDFPRVVQLLRELQLADAVQIRIERPKGDTETTIIVFPRSEDPQMAAKSAEIGRILRVKPGVRELGVYYGGYSGKDDEISMLTRSMLQIMLELGAIVQVPASDVASGKAAPGARRGPTGRDSRDAGSRIAEHSQRRSTAARRARGRSVSRSLVLDRRTRTFAPSTPSHP